MDHLTAVLKVHFLFIEGLHENLIHSGPEAKAALLSMTESMSCNRQIFPVQLIDHLIKYQLLIFFPNIGELDTFMQEDPIKEC